jgi:uncharacterized membrane protein YsdA (DUF1294 family)
MLLISLFAGSLGAWLQSQQTHIRLRLYFMVIYSLVCRRNYWAPDPDEYLWYRNILF